MVKKYHSRAFFSMIQEALSGLMLAIGLVGLLSNLASAQNKEVRIITQGEFAKKLVHRLDLEKEGVPENPTPEDYFWLLRGGETVKVEAEIAEKTSLTLVKNAFFETGFWISTLNTQESVNFPVEFPNSGVYWLRVRAKGESQFWKVDEKPTEVVQPSPVFQWLDLRRYVLKRGSHTIQMTIPLEGGVDFFMFSADRLNSGEPTGGFGAEKPLTYGAIAEILVRQLRVEDQLPVDDSYVFRVKIIEKRFATDRNPGIGRFPMKIEDEGVYSVKVALLGEQPVSFYIKGGRREVKPLQTKTAGLPAVASTKMMLGQQPEQQLQDITTAFFEKGDHTIEAGLPPYTSIEGFRQIKRRSTPRDYLEILKKFGIKVGEPDEYVTEEAAEEILEGFLASVSNPFLRTEESELPGVTTGGETETPEGEPTVPSPIVPTPTGPGQ